MAATKSTMAEIIDDFLIVPLLLMMLLFTGLRPLFVPSMKKFRSLFQL
jgi:hypothetical protein